MVDDLIYTIAQGLLGLEPDSQETTGIDDIRLLGRSLWLGSLQHGEPATDLGDPLLDQIG